MNLCLELSIYRICSEMIKLIRGFLAYFMWIRWMEDVCRDVGDTDGHVGGPRDLEDVRKKRKSRHSVIFFEFAVGFAEFFFATGSGQGVLEALDVPPGSQGEAVHSPQHQHHRHHKLAGSLTALTVTTRCDRLPACQAIS